LRTLSLSVIFVLLAPLALLRRLRRRKPHWVEAAREP